MINSFAGCLKEERGYSGFLIFFLSFSLILLFSLSPSVYVGDSPLFASASFFLGSAHPPAYPLYLLLGKLLTFIPFGNVAFKVNLLSAVSGAMAALLAYKSAVYITKRPVIGLIAPVLVLASPNFLLESAKSEVYTLNSFLVMTVFYLCLTALKESDFPKRIMISSFLFGLGMGNHHTIGFMLFVVIYVMIVRLKELPHGTVVFSMLFCLAGVSVYMYLYFRTLSGAFLLYSSVRSFYDFLEIFLRSDYGSGTLGSINAVSDLDAGWFYAVKNMGAILSSEFHPLIWLFVIFGVATAAREKKMLGFFVISLLTWVLLAQMTISSKNLSQTTFQIVDVYFLQMIPLIAVIGATGVCGCHEKVKNHSALVAKTVTAGMILFLLVFVAISLQKSSLSDYYSAYGWIKDVSKVLRPKSFYLAYGDNAAFESFYGFGVEKMRDDVLCLNATVRSSDFSLTIAPAWKFGPWYPEFYETELSSTKFFYPYARAGKVYSTFIGSIPQGIRSRFDIRPYVLTSVLLEKKSKFPYDEEFKKDFNKIDYLNILSRNAADFMDFEIVKGYGATISQYASILASGNSKDTDYFYRLAIYATKGREAKFAIIEDYVRYLRKNRGAAAARSFLTELKGIAATREALSELERIERALNRGPAS